MPNEKIGLIPNSTQTPNVIYDQLLPLLPDAELRCVLYICRRTFGFHKKTDRIGIGQFANGIRAKDGTQLDHGTGLRPSTARDALRNLAEAGIISKDGTRSGRANGYRLNTEIEIGPAIDTLKRLKGIATKRKNRVSNRLFTLPRPQHPAASATGGVPRPQQGGYRVRNTTKESIQNKDPKESMHSASPNAPQQAKPMGPHRTFMAYWHDEVVRSRGMKPVIVGKDGANLKRILEAGVSETALEQAATYFLNSYSFKTFSPSIATFLSAGVINGILNRMRNDRDFWKELDGYLARRGQYRSVESFPKNLELLKSKLTGKLSMPALEPQNV